MTPNGHLQIPAENPPQVPSKSSHKSSKNSKKLLFGIVICVQRNHNRVTQSTIFSASEVIALENKNWLIHYHYTRREFGICNILIKEELKKSNDMNEFVNYIQVSVEIISLLEVLWT